MLEKLEREHKHRLEQQQKQYEEHMHQLEEKMKQRLDDYLSSTATRSVEWILFSFELISSLFSLQNSHREPSPPEQYRPMGTDLINHYYPSNSSTHIPSLNLSRSQSREDMSRWVECSLSLRWVNCPSQPQRPSLAENRRSNNHLHFSF